MTESAASPTAPPPPASPGPGFRAPIFIWGCPRSGTTLMYRLLAGLGGLHSPRTPPTDELPDGDLQEGTGAWWAAFGEHRGAMGPDLLTDDRRRALLQAYRDRAPGLAEAGADGRLLDKCPLMIQWVPLIEAVFPDAHHVHLIRDGRGVLNSILYKLRHSDKDRDRPFQSGEKIFGPQTPAMLEWPADQPALRHAQQWVDLTQIGQNWAPTLGPRYHEVRYEALTADPRSVVGELCQALDVPVTPEVLEREVPATLPDKNELWQRPDLRVDDPVFSRRCSLTDRDTAGLGLMRTRLAELGYEVAEAEAGRPSAAFDKYARSGAYHWQQAGRVWFNKRFNAPLAGRYRLITDRITAPQGRASDGDDAASSGLNSEPAGPDRSRGGRVLDIGCGDGFLLHRVGRRLPDAELVGLDAEARGLELARQKLAEQGQTAELVEGDCTAMDFGDQSFDLALCADVIEHLEAREACVAEAARVLRPGGRLLLTTPNRLPGVPLGAYHTYEYDGPELRELLLKFFQTVTVHYAWPEAALQRWAAGAGDGPKAYRRWVKLRCSVGANPFARRWSDGSGRPLQLLAEAAGPRRERPTP